MSETRCDLIGEDGTRCGGELYHEHGWRTFQWRCRKCGGWHMRRRPLEDRHPESAAEIRQLKDALRAMLLMHERESGHREGGRVCANCFVAREVLAGR